VSSMLINFQGKVNLCGKFRLSKTKKFKRFSFNAQKVFVGTISN
jgi:hypothetical protein